MSKVKHQIDDDGHYCFSWCEACKVERKICPACGTSYGRYQWHGQGTCAKALKELKDKQLEFDFK